jgi:hypothetical protein
MNGPTPGGAPREFGQGGGRGSSGRPVESGPTNPSPSLGQSYIPNLDSALALVVEIPSGTLTGGINLW